MDDIMGFKRAGFVPLCVEGAFVTQAIREKYRDKEFVAETARVFDLTAKTVREIGAGHKVMIGNSNDGFQIVVTKN